MKRALSVLLACVLLLGLLPVSVFAELIGTNTAPTSGKTGDCTWTLDEKRHLTISGKGKMGDYYWSHYAPWGNDIASVTIEKGVTSIGDYAFYECTELTSVAIPDGITSIGEAAFYWCARLSSVAIPATVTAIQNEAFYGCDRLTSINFGTGVKTIGNKAFYDCDRLITVNIPDNVTAIGDWAFYHCDMLNRLNTGDGVKTIGDAAFTECKSLISLEIGSGVKSIGWGAFQGCIGLTAVNIPDNVATVDLYAFYDCRSLSDVTIGNGTTEIGERAFAGCDLTAITVAADNPNYCTVDNILFTKDKSVLVQYLRGRPGEYRIPDSVTVIDASAFEYCSDLTSVIIPDGVTVIGEAAFAECEKLVSVTIPDSVTTIGNSAFYQCSALTALAIPDSVTAIGEYAFYKCISLTDVNIPYGITAIEGGTFCFCESLADIHIPETVTAIRWDAFNGCISLTAITIPNTITAIEDNAFAYCSSLTAFIIPDRVTAIGWGAFKGCAKLTDVVIPAGVTDIRYNAFSKCPTLTNVWYSGTKQAADKIVVGADNAALQDAAWHYAAVAQGTPAPTCVSDGGYCFSCPDCDATLTVAIPATGHHAYDHACDTVCNVCDHRRTVAGHLYDGACDGDCNHCGATRTAKAHTWKNGKCAVCGKASPSKVKLTAQSATARYAKAGATVSAKVTAKGDGLQYRWYVKNAGATKYSKSSITKATYSVSMSAKVKGRRVYCIVTDKYGNKVQSKTFILRESVSIATQPKTVAVKKNATAKVTVKAKGDGLRYQWYVKNAGAKKYTKSSVKTATYSVKMTAKTKNRLLLCIITDKYGNQVQTKTVKLKMK